MKRLSIILTCVSILFCGCSQQSENSVPDETNEQQSEQVLEAATEETSETEPEFYVDANTTVFYKSEDEFFSSEFCQTMKEDGFTPLKLSYDTEQYDFFNIRSDAKFYNYNLNDSETGEPLSITITYDTYRTDVSEFGDNVRIPMETTITAVSKNDVDQEVYIYKKPYQDETEYTLCCIPMEGYELTISSGCSTIDEVTALFQQLDLVPAE